MQEALSIGAVGPSFNLNRRHSWYSSGDDEDESESPFSAILGNAHSTKDSLNFGETTSSQTVLHLVSKVAVKKK